MQQRQDMAGSMGICSRKSARRELANDLVAGIAHHRWRAYRFDISQHVKKRSDISDPMVQPTAQVRAINEKPRAMFVSSVSSTIILFMTPTFPLSIPFKQRLAKPSWSDTSLDQTKHTWRQALEKSGKGQKGGLRQWFLEDRIGVQACSLLCQKDSSIGTQ